MCVLLRSLATEFVCSFNVRPPRPYKMMQDKVYDFEKKRATVRKYDRETMLRTIRAMKRIAEIKKNRENVRRLQLCFHLCNLYV